MKTAQPLELQYPYTGLDARNNYQASSNPLVASEPSIALKGSSVDITGLREFEGYLKRDYGCIPLFTSAALDGNPCLVIQYSQQDGDLYFVVVTDEKIYKYVSTPAWTSLGAYTGTALRRVCATVYNDLLLITDRVNAIMQWNGTTLAGVTGLEALLSTDLIAFNNHLLLFDLVENSGTVEIPIWTRYPQRIRWSNVNNIEDFVTGTSGLLTLGDSPDLYAGREMLGDQLIVYKSRTIYNLLYVGYPDIFKPVPVEKGRGLLAPDTLISFEGVHIFLGNDDVYAFNGQGLTSVGGAIKSLLFGPNAIVNPVYLGTSKARFYEDLGEYWLAVPIGTSTVPNEIFRLDVANKTWWRRGSQIKITALGAWKKKNTISWDALVDSWEEQAWQWESSAMLAETAIPIIAGYSTLGDGVVNQVDFINFLDNSITPEAYRVTEELSTIIKTRYSELWMEVQGEGQLKLSYSTDRGSSWTDLTTKTISQNDWYTAKWGINLSTDSIKFKLTMPSGNVKFRKAFAWTIGKKR